MNQRVVILSILILILVCIACMGMYTLLYRKDTQAESCIPSVIWTYWESKSTMPRTVHECIKSWKKHNPSWPVILVTDENLNEYAPELDFKQLRHVDSLARKSDMIRLTILAKYGGVWCDASVLLKESLDWLQQIQKSNNYELVGYYLPTFTSDERYPVLESWFFGCVPGSTFVQRWKDEFFRMQNFDTVREYVESVESCTDLQKITMREYLAIHLSAQYVMQHLMTPCEIKDSLYLLDANEGPFRHWNAPSMKSLCTNPEYQTRLIKFIREYRKTIEKEFDDLTCLFE